MRPSSSTSDGLLGPLFGAPDVDVELDDAALLLAMLDVEAALAEAGADAGVVPPDAAAAVAAACRSQRPDVAEIGAAADASGNPVVPLVRWLGGVVPEAARPWVHHGATSQDVLDTALVLVVRAAGERLAAHLAAAADAAAELARRHRDTLAVARTLGQQALPTTFGLKAAGWLGGLDAAADTLDGVLARGLAVQLGGAAGTLASNGAAGPAVVAALAARLDLPEPVLPWHTDRQRVLRIAAALGGVAAACGKVAVDVGLLAQTEVGEVAEGGEGRGGSSAMPHKRNPVDAVLVTAIARRAPGLVGTLFAAALHEHERAAGSWHAEWQPLRELLSLAGGAAARTARLLSELEVRPDRMRANLDATGGLVMAEAVAARLMPALGRAEAQRAVARCADAGGSFHAALLADPDVAAHLSAADVDAALDPRGWLGSAGALVDRALAAHAGRPRPADPRTRGAT